MGRGVLRQAAAADKFSLRRHEPPADLARFLDFFWVIRWDLRGEPAYEQSILPHPNVNLAFEDTGAAVYGVDTRIFTRRLTGAGKALGVRFLPGGFRPFCSGPVSALTDRVVVARDFFGAAADEACRVVMAAEGDEDMITPAANLLRAAAAAANRPGAAQSAASQPGASQPAASQPGASQPAAGTAVGSADSAAVALAASLTARIAADPAMRRVSQLANAAGTTERQLQRLFAEYVGVSPKWVLCRARLHEAALRAETGDEIDWAALAAELGYADQAHLTRDFTATIGTSPARYAGSVLSGVSRAKGNRWRHRTPTEKVVAGAIAPPLGDALAPSNPLRGLGRPPPQARAPPPEARAPPGGGWVIRPRRRQG